MKIGSCGSGLKMHAVWLGMPGQAKFLRSVRGYHSGTRVSRKTEKHVKFNFFLKYSVLKQTANKPARAGPS